jgi:AcrR family transcriptional regulator
MRALSKARNGPGRPRAAAADRAILRAALRLFTERGIDGASIEQIAARAAVARTTVYRRWKSKEALIAEALASARGAPEQQTVAHQAALSSMPRLLVDALAETLTQRDFKKLAARLIGSAPSCPRLTTVYWNNYIVPRRKIISTLLNQARDQGLLREDSDPEILLDLIGGAIAYHLLIRPGERTADEMRTYLIKVLRQLGLMETAASRKRVRANRRAR